jgi:DNA-binding NarL/FixJ family response regulator
MSSGDRIRVLLVDDNADFRAGIAEILSAACDVVGTLDDGDGIEDAVERWCPDVVVLDNSMPKVSGFEAARRLLAACPDAKIIFLSNHTDAATRGEARNLGVRAVLNKTGAAKDLLGTVQVVHRNGMLF